MKTINKKKIALFDIVNVALVLVITVLVLYPLYFCVIASFSNPNEIAEGNVIWGIRDFTLDSYGYVFKEKRLWTGYRNTIIYTFFGTLYNLVLTIPAAYVVSKKYLPYRSVISWYFFITMYVSGGMIPTYFLIKSLGLIDNPMVMIIGAGISCGNLIITRQYFTSSIPNDIYEAAYVDGAGEGYMFVKIALPLAKPILAVMTLYFAVGRWNSYMDALLYLRDEDYSPLQLVLRSILMSNQISILDMEATDIETISYMLERSRIAEGMKYAIVFIACAPLLIAYPFVQKHFTQGITMGSVKG